MVNLTCIHTESRTYEYLLKTMHFVSCEFGNSKLSKITKYMFYAWNNGFLAIRNDLVHTNSKHDGEMVMLLYPQSF